jgi:hypothetical protein
LSQLGSFDKQNLQRRQRAPPWADKPGTTNLAPITIFLIALAVAGVGPGHGTPVAP